LGVFAGGTRRRIGAYMTCTTPAIHSVVYGTRSST
jgi:hypothetical protein